MTEATVSQTRRLDGEREALDGPLRRLSALGLRRPQHLTVGRFLELLVEEDLVAASTVTDYVDILQEIHYGGVRVDDLNATAAISALEGAIASIDRNEPGFRRLIDLCTPPPSSPEPPQPEVESDALADEPDDAYQLNGSEDETMNEEEDSSGFRWNRRRIVTACLLGVWTIAMLTAGYYGKEIAAWGFAELRYQLFGGVRAGDRLEIARTRAVKNPESVQSWAAYADLAQRHELWEQTISARRHLVVRHPDNAEMLNSLAWLLCTAGADHVRDPVEALGLAERAYSLNPAPHITDTLAEAEFQNGNVVRAVDLAKEALERVDGDNAYYRRQLEKFSAELED
ncbi:MAG: hypothetical protein GY906_36725 [bacterium]|nr:hypothetical protein [bacterium]